MLKVLKYIGYICLPIIIVLIGFIVGISNIGDKVLKNTEIKQTFIDGVEKSLSSISYVKDEQITEVEQILDDSKYLDELIDMYVEAFLNNCLKGGELDVSGYLDDSEVKSKISKIENEVVNGLMSDSSGILKSLQKTVISEVVSSKTDDIQQQITDKVNENINKIDKNKITLVRFYAIASCTHIKQISFIIMVLLVVLIILCSNVKRDALFGIGMETFISGIIFAIISYIIKKIINVVGVSFSVLYIYAVVTVIVGIIIWLIGFIIEKVKN